MHRRSICCGPRLRLFGAAFAAARAGAAHRGAATKKLKVVYHLNDLDKVRFRRSAISRTILTASAAPTTSPSRWWFMARRCGRSMRRAPIPIMTRHVGQFSKAGVELAVCGNTMKIQKVGLHDLLPGFVAVDQGGVVRIAELQSQGYLYLRP